MELSKKQQEAMQDIKIAAARGQNAYMEVGPMKRYHTGTLKALERKGLITLRRFPMGGGYYATLVK